MGNGEELDMCLEARFGGGLRLAWSIQAPGFYDAIAPAVRHVSNARVVQ